MTKQITLITNNPHKAEQASRYLNHPVNHQKLELEEIQAESVEEVIKNKTIKAFNKLKSPVLVDDVAAIFKSLGNMPGPFIKFFLNQPGGEEKLCRMLDGFSDRSATGKVAIGYHNGKNVNIFIGEVNGKVADHPAGENGFGWDSIFVPNGYTKTRAQMNEEDYDKTSPRRIALEKLAKFLNGKN